MTGERKIRRYLRRNENWKECPELVIDGRLRRCKASFRSHANVIALKSEKYRSICGWSEDEFLSTYLHELAHWATWLMASVEERRKMEMAYLSAVKQGARHNDLFVEKIAFWVSGTF
jgi:hypothetical protein